MVRKIDAVAGVVRGDEIGRVKNVVDAEGGKFTDVGIAQAVAFLQKTVHELWTDGVVGIGKRSVVEVAAQDYFVGRLGDVFPYQKSLAGSGFVGADDAAKDVFDAIGKILCRAGCDFFDEFPLFVSEAVGFEVNVVNPEGVFPFQHVTVLSRTGMAFVKSDASGMENG